MAFNLQEAMDNEQEAPVQPTTEEVQGQSLQLTPDDVVTIQSLKAKNDFSGIGKYVAELV